ncbi:MAG: hypothetical protein QOE96_4199 [Blastocatellia bacterium]|jgi:signal transduction histidine kinase|nr:hypothetical protein [Blastocatellia bacterium]
MATAFRKTGISVVGDAPWGTHFCHFYETKQDLLDTVVPYFKAGLENKEFCLWVISDSDLITVEEAIEALAQAVPGLDRQLSDQNIEILNRQDWYFERNVLNLERVKNAWDEKLKRALARGYDGMRASGDTFWLAEKDWEDFFAYEKQINDWITDQHMTVLCTYPLAKSGATEILDVVQAHQFVIARRRGEWEVVETPELIQAKAEIKRLNDALQRVKEVSPERTLFLRYGVAVLSVTAALIIALWMRLELGQQSTPVVVLFLCGVMFSAWFGGFGPGLLAIALSLLAIDYWFAIPIYSLAVDIREIPRLIVFTLSALFVGSLSAAQRSKASSLRRARDVLDETVQELKRTNQALRTENADRKQAEEKLKATSERLRALTASVQSAREEEATRIAREIHDELGSALTSLKLDLASIRRETVDSASDTDLSRLREKLETMMQLVDQTVDTVRRISSELRPSILDDIGLVAAIRWQGEQFEAKSGIACRYDIRLEDVDLNRQQSTDMFRVFQEAMTNILRHAQATRVDISLKKEDNEIVLTIRDDGRGITADEKSGRQSLGLLGMRERVSLIGGAIDITGAAGKGTVITVRLTIPRKP